MKLKVVVQPYLAHAPLFIARDESLFVRQGLDVEFVSMAKATDALPLLLNGDVDVVASALVPGTLNAMARGEALRIVADRGHLAPDACTFYAIVVRPGLLRDGRLTHAVRRISIDRQAPMLYIVEKALARWGASWTAWRRRRAARAGTDGWAIGSLERRSLGEPWHSRIGQAGAGSVISARDALPGCRRRCGLFGPASSRGTRKPDVASWWPIVRQWRSTWRETSHATWRSPVDG